jgi:hypothetical protein
MGDIFRQRNHNPSLINKAVDTESGVLVTAATTLQPSYTDGLKVALNAVDTDPNTIEPAATRLIFAGDDVEFKTVNAIALYPVYTGAAGNTTFRVWVKSGLDALVGPEWVPVADVAFDGSGDLETVVNVGNRTTFVQALTGVNVTPVNLFIAVA